MMSPQVRREAQPEHTVGCANERVARAEQHHAQREPAQRVAHSVRHRLHSRHDAFHIFIPSLQRAEYRHAARDSGRFGACAGEIDGFYGVAQVRDHNAAAHNQRHVHRVLQFGVGIAFFDALENVVVDAIVAS